MNYKRSWFEPLVDDTEFLEADFVDFRYPRHVHETFAIGVIERGAQRFASKSGETLMPSHTLCVVDPDVVHWGWPATEVGWRYRMFYPSVRVVEAALDTARIADRFGFGEAVIDDPELFARFGGLHRRASAGDRLGLDDDVTSFLADLCARHGRGLQLQPTADCARAAATAREYLHAHVFSDVRLADLAAATGVSEAHVSRSFRRAFGMAPYAYLLAVRIERSKQMLVSGRRIAEVAAACGFHDQSHFHRTFRRLVGVPPGRFVRNT
ncbi:MAG: AraC family transcriptional regulator [Actinomycetota bacterium]